MPETDRAFEQAVADAAKAETVFDRMPPWIVDRLTPEQKEAIYNAVKHPEWKFHPINIRLSVPVIKRRYYVTVVGGEDGRSAARRQHDSHRYPLRTAANVFFALGIAALFYMLAIVFLGLKDAFFGP